MSNRLKSVVSEVPRESSDAAVLVAIPKRDRVAYQLESPRCWASSENPRASLTPPFWSSAGSFTPEAEMRGLVGFAIGGT